MPNIVAKPSILKSEVFKAEVPEGISVAEALGDIDDKYTVILEGEVIPKDVWEKTYLGKGQELVVNEVPRGGDVKDVFKTVLYIAAIATVTYLSFGAAGLIAQTYGLSGLTTQVIGATLSTLGIMAVNALIPPPSLEPPGSPQSVRRRQSLTGVRNRFTPYAPIPKVYGTVRYFPPLAASYYTETAGNEQYIRILLCLGFAPLQIGGYVVDTFNKITEEDSLPPGTIKIGDTGIENFPEAQFEIGTINSITLFTQDIVEVNPNVNFPLRSTQLTNLWFEDGDSAINTTAIDAEEISVDITFPAGLWSQDSKGRPQDKNMVAFRIEYAPTGTNNWTTVLPDRPNQGPPNRYVSPIVVSNAVPTDDLWVLTANIRETYSFTIKWKVPKGQYDVRVTRVQSYVPGRSPAVFDAIWTALRTIRSSRPWNDSNTVLMALRLKAGDGSSSFIDRVSVEATSILNVFDGTNWSKQPTSNPAWAYYDALTGIQLDRPIAQSKIDVNALKDWADWCTANNIEYNFVHDGEETLLQRIKNIAATGHASWALKDGQFSVIRDLTTGTEVQVISPRNAVSFKAEKVFQDLPHALRIRYIDGNVWEEDSITVYRSGYNSSNATIFEEIATRGITSQQQAWFFGQYFFRQAILRPEVYTVVMDYENLVATRGDLVRLAYDTIKVGLQWARIIQVNSDTQIVVDEKIVVGSGTYAIRVRKNDGTTAVSNITNSAGTYTTLNLATAISGMNVGDLVLFGVAGSESLLTKITRIRYMEDFKAEVQLVDAALDIYNFGSPPAYNPQISNPLDLADIPPAMPTISYIESGTKALYLDGDGAVRPSIVLGFEVSSGNLTPIEIVQVAYREAGTWAWQYAETEKAETQAIRLTDGIVTGGTYEIRIRARSPFGMWSDWSSPITHTVIGKDAPPSDVTNFVAAQNGDVAVFTWDPIPDPDLSGYEIRYGPKGNTNWEDATPLTQVTKGTQITTAKLPTGSWTVFIKAVDSAVPPNYSVNAAQDDIDFVSTYDVITQQSEQPFWPGVRKNFVKHPSGVLVPDSQIPADVSYTSDTFTDSDGIWLGLHQGERALWYEQQAGQPVANQAQIYGNRMVGVTNELNIYDAGASILHPDYMVTATIYVASIQGNIGIAVRHDPNNEQYYAFVVDGTNIYIVKNGAYNQSEVLASKSYNLTVGNSYTFTFRVKGNALDVWLGRPEDEPASQAGMLLSATDSDLISANFPGIIKVAYPGSGVSIPAGTADTQTTGFHIDEFYATYGDGWLVFDQFVLEPFPICEYYTPYNMMTNGDGNTGDNTNFSQFVYDPNTGSERPGSFSYTSLGGTVTSDEYIEVDTNRTYRISAAFKTGVSGNRIYAGLACYDKNKNVITFQGSWRDPNKNTTLYADAPSGATVVDIVPAAEPWFDVNTPFSYIQFNIKDDGSDLPHDGSTMIKITNIDTSNPSYWRLTLQNPLPHSYRAGTPVGNSTSGANYNYILASNIAPGTTFTQRTGTITGENGITERPPTSKFRRGTKYIRFLLLPNRDQNDTTWVDDVSFILENQNEIDIGFNDAVRATLSVDSALGPGESGIANPKTYIDHRKEEDAYDGYKEWSIGNLVGRYFKAKTVLDTSLGIAYLKGLDMLLDNKERVESTDNILVQNGVKNVTFARPFHKTPFVKVTVLSNVPYFAVADNVTAQGFTIRLFDTNGNAGTVDTIVGYEATGV